MKKDTKEFLQKEETDQAISDFIDILIKQNKPFIEGKITSRNTSTFIEGNNIKRYPKTHWVYSVRRIE